MMIVKYCVIPGFVLAAALLAAAASLLLVLTLVAFAEYQGLRSRRYFYR